MDLIVGATPDSGWLSLLPLIEHLGFSAPDSVNLERWQVTTSGTSASLPSGSRGDDSRRLQARQFANAELLASCQHPAVLDMTACGDSLEHWLEMGNESRLLICYSRPEQAIHLAMARQESPADAVVTWQAITLDLLHVLRRHRQRALVVNVEHAVAAPNRFLQLLSQFLGLNDAQPWRGGVESSFSPPADDLLALISAQAVAQTPSVADLLNELDASAPPIGAVSMPPIIDYTQVWEDHERARAALNAPTAELQALQHQSEQAIADRNAQAAELQTLKTQLEETTSENEILLVQLHRVQEELESIFLEAQAQKETLLNRQKQLEQAKSARATLEAERQMLQKQLKQTTERERRARQHAERERDALLSSLSWRLTTPLRWLLKPIMGTPFKTQSSH